MGAILTHMLGCKAENNEAHIQCPLKGFFQKIFSFFRTKPEAPYYSLKKPVSSTVKLNKHLNNLIDASNTLDNELQQLTREEKKFINKSWHSFMKLPPTNSVNTFVTFLQENPKYRKFFKSVDGIPLEDLQYNFRMPEPIIGIFLYVNSMIHCLENADAMFFLSLQVGLLHSDKGLAVEDFKLFKKYVIKILQEELGLSEEGTSVWNKVLDIFMSVFYVGMEF